MFISKANVFGTEESLLDLFQVNNLVKCTKQDPHTGNNPYNLPHLPVPKLNTTLATYLHAVEPLLTSEAFEKTTNIVRNFGEKDGLGQRLQHLLEAKASASDNWLYDWWTEQFYLGNRQPLILHSNPGGIFAIQDFKSENDWLRYAAKVISATLKFKERIDRNEMPVDKIGDTYLDMSSYENIFGTCRIPQSGVDYLQFHPDSKHIVVAYQNEVITHAYEFNTHHCYFKKYFYL